MSKILILAPHTDDAEIGCGGTISKWLKEGHQVKVVVFSAAQPFDKPIVEWKDSDTDTGIYKEIYSEFYQSMEILGIDDCSKFLFQLRKFDTRRQDILERMIEIRNEFQPDMVLCPSTTDFHQDHQIVSQEAIRAFKNTTILGYEYPWNALTQKHNYFIKLDKKDIDIKLKALSKYKSQKGRPYMEKEFIESWARTTGIQVGTKYAESFETIRVVL